MINEYRVHITVRRKNRPVFTSIELPTEHFDELADLNQKAAEFITETIYDDKEYQEEHEGEDG